MTDMIDCPAEGCDYSGPRKSVKGHWGGKQNEKHNGAFHKALETATEAQSEASDNPTMGDGGGDGVDDGQELDENPDGGHDLPCGHDTFAWDDVPDRAIHRNEGVRMTTVTCPDCGQSWTVTDE